MIWHIFRKDARLLWTGAVLVAALAVCAAIPHYATDHGNRSFQMQLLGDVLSALALLGVMVLMVVAMHQDPVPGVRQDWLIRPVWRRDLALAKILFALLLIQAPLWVIDTGIGLADGFGLPAAGLAAAGRNVQILCEFVLPAMLIGAITSSFVEACVLTGVVLICYMAVFQLGLSLLLGQKTTVGDSGVAWLFTAAFDVMALIGLAVVFSLQYLRRRTALARLVVALGGAVVLSVAFMPWGIAFSMQTALAPNPGSGRAIAVAFDSRAGRYQLPLGAAPAITSALHLPLHFTDIPANSVVLLDRADVRITAPDGSLLYQGKSSISVDGRGSMRDAQFQVRTGSIAQAQTVYQRIYLPTEVYARLANRPVRMSVDYSLTLFGVAHAFAVPATGAREDLPGLGHCATNIDAEGDDVVIGCLSMVKQALCYSAYLEDPATGARNPEAQGCLPDYSPAVMTQFWPDTIHRANGEVRFFDRSGMAHFPVDGTMLARAKLNLTTFEARDHFTRHIETSELKLADLSGAIAAAPPQPEQVPLRKLY